MKNKYRNSLISLVLSFIAITIIFGLLGIVGGEYSLFEGDDYQQYLVFIRDFIDSVRNGQSIWYSFANYLGSGNILTVAYYCLSPFNIIFYLCSDNFFLAFYLVIVLKLSFAAASFCFFVSEFTEEERTYHIIASLFYAVSGYAITWYFDIMWLDSFYMLPILVAFIVRYVKKNTYIALIFIYGYIFITNFYMAYIVGVFSAIFFVSYLLYYNNYVIKGRILYYLKRGFGFAAIVLLAAGMSAAILLPAAGFLSEHMADDNVSFNAIGLNLLDILNSLYIGEFQTMDNKVPVLYCGLPTAAFVFFYFINNRISIRQKIFWAVQIGFYIVGMITLPLYKFLHAFDYPNYYGYRFSFVIVFIILTISCTAIYYVQKEDIFFFKCFSAIAIVFYSFMMTMQMVNYGGNRLNEQSGLLINSILIICWLGLIVFVLKKEKKASQLLKIGMVFLASIEIIINGYICIENTDFVHIEKSLISEWYYAGNKAFGSIKESDEGFYRIYVNNDVNMNSGKMFGYNGLNTFSSADNYNLRMALARLGFSTSNRYIRTNCNIPVIDSLFAVNYYVGMPPFEEYIDGISTKDNYIEATVEKNKYPMTLGYMVAPDILDFGFSNNSFDNIEMLCKAMSGMEADFFDEIVISDDDILIQNYQANVIEGRTYFSRLTEMFKGESGIAFILSDYDDNRYIEFSYEKPGSYMAFPNVVTDEEGAYHSKLLAEGGIYKMGNLDGSSYVKISTEAIPAQNFYLESVYAAEYDETVFEPIYEELIKNSYSIDINEKDFISGTVIATEEKPFLFTSIPYDPEWHIYVDEQPITRLYRVVGDAFMAIELTPGEHTVSFQYIEKWSNEGIIISLISVSILCLLILLGYLRMRRNTTRKTDDGSVREMELNGELSEKVEGEDAE